MFNTAPGSAANIVFPVRNSTTTAGTMKSVVTAAYLLTDTSNLTCQHRVFTREATLERPARTADLRPDGSAIAAGAAHDTMRWEARACNAAPHRPLPVSCNADAHVGAGRRAAHSASQRCSGTG